MIIVDGPADEPQLGQVTSLDLLKTRAETVGGIDRVYKTGSVPKVPRGAAYVVLSLDTGTPSTYTNDGSSDSMHMLAGQCFGATQDAARDMAHRLDLAFRDKVLTELVGMPLCNRTRATQPTWDPDGGGLVYILHVYTFHQED